jgi:alanine racemase
MTPNSLLEINLTALAENVRQIQAFLSPGTELCAVVKANAYGLGAAIMAPELQRLGVNWQAVYDPFQAEEILQAGVSTNILILMPMMDIDPDSLLAVAAKARRIHCTVHGVEQMRSLAEAAKRLDVMLPVHIELDTGMSRGGQLVGSVNQLIAAIRSSPNLLLAGIFTHPSSADSDAECTEKQLADFDRATVDLPKSIIHHFANTWATIADKRYHRQMVRVGLGLWGYPSAGTWTTVEHNGIRLRPVARWVSRIVHIKNVSADCAVGYGQTFHTTRPTRIGIIPLGYADGYPLLLSNRGIVRIGPNLQLVPLIGRVNMDQIIVDLTDVADVSIGTKAEIISDDPTAPNAMHKLAELAQSHPYEMLCRISTRVQRKYLK